MRKITTSLSIIVSVFLSAQAKNDTIKKEKDLQEVVLTGKKPTVETKADRTVFNVASSSVLAGNTTWDIMRMTPLVSIDNNDNIKAEGQPATVYINDRKSVFTGKELKEYLKTIPAENLMKVEVITSPSAKYETEGGVINIVLKRLENEGIKGSLTFTNTQNTKNSQYSNFNLSFHKKNFIETFSGSYGDNTSIIKNNSENFLFADQSLTKINSQNTEIGKTPSFSSSSELELNEKNTVGLIMEYAHTNRKSFSNAESNSFINNILNNYYSQNQNLTGLNRNIGSNVFYKYYDKVKNKILDFNVGMNYDSVSDTNHYFKFYNGNPVATGNQIIANNENREYYIKADYSQPLGTSGSHLEFGGKMDFKNNVIPYDYFTLNQNAWQEDLSRSNDFHYLDNLNSLYVNFSKTYFKKLETRIGLRYEHIWYKIKQDVGNIEKTNSYGTLLPDLLLKYSFSDKYDLTATYKHNIWRPWFSEYNPFLLPSENGTYYRGNMDLQANPNDRFVLKFGINKKYFISTSYWFSNHDYWGTYVIEDGKTISMPNNFDGRVERYSVNFNTNQMFLKNKLSVNLDLGLNYTDNSDFNTKNNLEAKNYITNFGGSSNISYTNLFNKNININGWFGVFTQSWGNSIGNKTNFFHNISATKIFPNLQMEATLRLSNIFLRPNFDNTTFTPIGTFRNKMISDWYGASLTLVKRFGNQKVKESSKTNVEKDGGGGKQ